MHTYDLEQPIKLGERPTRMFCNLEKYNGTQKYVPQLVVTDEDGSNKTITEQNKVEQEILDFYSNLYSCKDNLIEMNSLSDFLGQESTEYIQKLKNNEKEDMEGKITLKEMTCYLKNYATYNRSARVLFSNMCLLSNIRQVQNKFDNFLSK